MKKKNTNLKSQPKCIGSRYGFDPVLSVFVSFFIFCKFELVDFSRYTRIRKKSGFNRIMFVCVCQPPPGNAMHDRGNHGRQSCEQNCMKGNYRGRIIYVSGGVQNHQIKLQITIFNLIYLLLSI